ncbi:MAG: ERAP1-like C-terminal domain-containing protein, partial [Acidimicrobiaceae bacterium]|nr:ERAP1-like C-terminal domain-containing protein [Acidimicrobiaceae bacterium]
MSPLERMALVSDTWAAVVAGKAPLEELVTLVLAMREEDDPDVWATMQGPFTLLDTLVRDDERPVLRDFIRHLAGPAFARLGWDPPAGEPQRSAILRGRLVNFLGGFGADAEVRAEASRRFAEYLAQGPDERSSAPALAPDVLTPAVYVTVGGGGVDTWNTVRQQYLQATNPQDRIRYLQALNSTEDPELLIAALDA